VTEETTPEAKPRLDGVCYKGQFQKQSQKRMNQTEIDAPAPNRRKKERREHTPSAPSGQDNHPMPDTNDHLDKATTKTLSQEQELDGVCHIGGRGRGENWPRQANWTKINWWLCVCVCRVMMATDVR
jgi:hypothetical protein